MTLPKTEQDLLAGVYQTTSWLFALILLALLHTRDYRILLGYALGAGLGVGLLKVLEWSVRTALRTEATGRERATVLTLHLLKYGVVGLLFWFTLSRDLVNVYALCAGFLLPQTVVFLQSVGHVLIVRRKKESSVAEED